MANFPYQTDQRLIIVPVLLHGPRGVVETQCILDTGASLTLIEPFLVAGLGYSVRDSHGFSHVSSVVGKETGFRIFLEELVCFEQKFTRLEVACHELGLEHIGGLIGMNCLEQIDYCVLHSQKSIRVIQR